MDNSNERLIDVVSASLSNITAGIVLIIFTVLVYLDMFSLLRNPLFTGFLGLVFFITSYVSMESEKNQHSGSALLNLDLNGIIAGVSLLAVSIAGAAGHFEVVRNFLFPLIPGVILMTAAFARSFIKASYPNLPITRTDPCTILGGQILILYSILLYMGLASFTWSPLFPLLVAGALYTTLFMEVLPHLANSSQDIHNVAVWMAEIEEKAYNLRREFEYIKLNSGDLDIDASLERLNIIQKAVAQLKELSGSIMLGEVAQPALEIQRAIPIQHVVTKPTKTGWNMNPESMQAVEIESHELESLVQPRTTEELFYESIQKEIDVHGLRSIIKEAKEMRESMYAQRKTLEDI
ncbi:MAG: hypothetical protein K0A89_11185 [ANME-2 cluster archaeon]|nr:hypothetical protein [ANME-2 cluster archaeon]MBW6519049.1 hypothetical protein [ANME-2 cluster archaeon]